MRNMDPSSVEAFWPLPWGSPPEPPSPREMYSMPSGPKPSCPPLWLLKGCGTSRTTKSLSGIAVASSKLTVPRPPIVNRAITDRRGLAAE
jgi:hypothetical protein